MCNSDKMLLSHAEVAENVMKNFVRGDFAAGDLA